MKHLAMLRERGVVDTVSDEALEKVLCDGMTSFYIGYDPTAKSLQIGNLFAIVTMRRLQMMGHRPVVLVGGATGMIGDPSGRGTERNMLDEATLAGNLRGIRSQLEKLIDFDCGKNSAIMVNNYDWLSSFSFLSFLRDVGRRFRVSEMMAKESVKRRMEAEDGISYTEFTYQILQAYDFLHLYKNHGVRMQAGGGDQWGNITAGIELVRKVLGETVYGMVIPLVTDSQGRKFGKSLGGTIYLDPEMSSPYQMYQFLLNSEDSCVIQYLKYYTFLSLDEIGELESELVISPEKRTAQKVLAARVVEYVHGREGLEAAERSTAAFFGGDVNGLSGPELAMVFSDVPSLEIGRDRLSAGIGIVDLLAMSPLWKGKNDVRRSIEQKGAYLNNKPVESIDLVVTGADLVGGNALVLRKGKKNYALVKVVD